MTDLSTTDMGVIISNAKENAHKAINNQLSNKANPHIIIDLVCTDIARGMYKLANGERDEVDVTEKPTEPEPPSNQDDSLTGEAE